MKVALLALVLLAAQAFSYIDYHGTMNDFMGVNVHQQLWQYHYLGTNADYDMHIPFRWVRNYHPWTWFEPVNDTYLWNYQGEGEWKWYDEYYRRLDRDSVNLLICVLSPPSWVVGGTVRQFDNGDGSTENNYREKAEYLAQLSARFGPTGGHAQSDLETSDKVQGLDYCRYFEDANEENDWWDTAYWTPLQYGKFLNAAHDGRGVLTGASLPIAGVKEGDAKAFHVLGGLANNGIDKTPKCNGSYLDSAVIYSGRPASQVMDVINIHLYWNTTDSIPWPWTGAAGVCPENGLLERGNNDIAQIEAWRDAKAPGMQVWLTEFGWDTYTGGGDNHSYQYAPELSQANYIMRSFALLKYLGLAKAFVYFDQDPNSASATQYASCGLVKDATNNFSRKTSFFFMATMRAMIGDYYFASADKQASGSPQLYVYRFYRSAQDVVLMVWCRQAGQKVDNGTVIQNCAITVSGMQSCLQVKPQPGLLYGQSSILTVSNPGAGNASVTVPVVSETPLFLKLAGEGMGTSTTPSSLSLGPHFAEPRVWKNSALFDGLDNGSIVTVFRTNGRISWRAAVVGNSIPAFSGVPGIYVYSIKAACGHVSAKGIFVLTE
jgi:hypothetical protein